MNATLLGIVKGIAVSAKAANPIDQNSMSLCQEIIQRAEYVFGTTYDASTTSTAAILRFPNYPAGNVAPSYDTIGDVGVTNIRTIGG